MNHQYLHYLLTLLFPTLVSAAGKGPVGIYVINTEYVLTVDSSVDALLVIDVIHGGIVGQKILNDLFVDDIEPQAGVFRPAKNLLKKFVNPTGVASCDGCKYIWMSSTKGAEFYRIELQEPLAQMALNRNFASLEKADVKEYWPWKDKKPGPCQFRYVAVTPDGSRGFLEDYNRGLHTFDPNDIDGNFGTSEISVFKYLTRNEMNGFRLRGLVLGRDGRTLHLTGTASVKTGSKTSKVFIMDAYNKTNIEEVDINKECFELYSHLGKGTVPDVRDGVTIGDALYVYGDIDKIGGKKVNRGAGV
mmetsp:Transcript_50356/g.151661  ORF Transcript_50356/g.151661 Transcript_50356/m.151661 type:complete len:303 (+) Transcript_50356:210-1118(+)